MTGKEALETIKKYNDYALMRLLVNDVLSPETIGSPSEKDCRKAIDVIKQTLEVLDQYKNIEQELGIDFITLYKALTSGVWVKNESGQIYHINVYLHTLILSSSSVKNNFCFIALNNELLLFDRIKQNWALTKEELENEIHN